MAWHDYEPVNLTPAQEAAWQHYIEFYSNSIAAVNTWSKLGPNMQARMLNEAAKVDEL